MDSLDTQALFARNASQVAGRNWVPSARAPPFAPSARARPFAPSARARPFAPSTSYVNYSNEKSLPLWVIMVLIVLMAVPFLIIFFGSKNSENSYQKMVKNKSGRNVNPATGTYQWNPKQNVSASTIPNLWPTSFHSSYLPYLGPVYSEPIRGPVIKDFMGVPQ